MERRLLESKTGERITWKEAIMRALKGIGHPVKVKVIAEYMLDHVITEFPETAKTPLQTIYRELYTHSFDSPAGRNHEHIFTNTGKGVWGLFHSDSWRKQRSEKVCDPMVLKALARSDMVQTEEFRECCDRLREKASEWELLFGEILLLEASEAREKLTSQYFSLLWKSSYYLRSLLDLYIWEITDSRIKAVFEEQQLSEQHRRLAMRWVNGARQSSYNIRVPEQDYGLHNTPVVSQSDSVAASIASIIFPENYHLPPNAHLSTVFKYFVFRHREEYSQDYLVRTIYGSYKKIKPLHEKPYRLIRPEHILECTAGLSKAQRYRVIVLYRHLDSLAYEENLIQRRYAQNLRPGMLVADAEHMDEFTQEEIDNLKEHRGELEVDMTLVLLYTGLGVKELCELTFQDVDDKYIHFPNERTTHYGRDIPVHSVIVPCLRHVLRFLEDRDVRNAGNNRQRYGILQMVHTATEKYCEKKHTPSQCRSSFETRVKEAGASEGMVAELLGVRLQTLSAYQQTYIHPSPDRIWQSVMNMK